MSPISTSLLSLLALTAAASTAAAAPLTPRSTLFTLTDIVVTETDTYSAPPHISAYSNSVSFSLTNTAISRTTACHVTLTGSPADIVFDGSTAYVCDGGVSDFHFTDSGSVFTVNDDTGATGTASAAFTTTSSSVINPDWTSTNGEVYKTETQTSSLAELDIIAVVT